MPGPHLVTLKAPDGTPFRDLDHDGVMAPFEDPRLTPDERAADLVGRLSLAEKVGLLFHNVVEVGPGGTLVEGDHRVQDAPTSDLVVGLRMNHLNLHGGGTARELARWSNALQEQAATTPHSIPVTVSSDPRHSFTENLGAAFAAGSMSAWPEPLGLAALRDAERVRAFADVTRQEYVAVGIREALHPQIDLATDPRWGRQFHTWGNDAAFTADVAQAYVTGLQGTSDLGPASVAAMVKHFPGGGPQADGEDPHFPYGADQVYPGGRFEEHLVPFRRAIAAGTAAVMPYYGKPVGLLRGGEAIEEVGFGFNRQVITGILREELGYDGVVCTDWGLVTGMVVFGKPLPARAHGVEHLSEYERVVKIIEAGCDQFGGESCPNLVERAVAEGRVTEARIDESAHRLLRVKFALGLFDDPFVDEDAAEALLGNATFRATGRRAQAESMVLVRNDGILPLAPGGRVYVEGVAPDAAARLGEVVADPADADVAVVRLAAPFDPRDDLFLEGFFHAGSLEYRPGRLVVLRELARRVPLVVDANLERPALLGPLKEFASAIVTDVGSSSDALVDVLLGEVAPRGVLPFDIPRDMDAVRASAPDVPNDTADPVFRAGHGLTYPTTATHEGEQR